MDIPEFLNTIIPLNTLSTLSVPPIVTQISIIILLFGYSIIYYLTRTKYGVDPQKLDIKLETNQDFLVAPILISLPIIISSFIIIFCISFMLNLFLGPSFNGSSLNWSTVFYIYFTAYIFLTSKKIIERTRNNNKLLQNSINSFFFAIIIAFISFFVIVLFSIVQFFYGKYIIAFTLIELKEIVEICVAIPIGLFAAYAIIKLVLFYRNKEFNLHKLSFIDFKKEE